MGMALEMGFKGQMECSKVTRHTPVPRPVTFYPQAPKKELMEGYPWDVFLNSYVIHSPMMIVSCDMVRFLVPVKIDEFGCMKMRSHALRIIANVKDLAWTFLAAYFVQKRTLQPRSYQVSMLCALKITGLENSPGPPS